MKISDLAKQAGCTVETVRYYEKVGLLPAPVRTAGNYRDYGERHIEALQFLRNCRALDMSHEEIRELLHWRENSHPSCGEINALIDRHIQHVNDRIGHLQALEVELKALKLRCNAEHEVETCGILQGLAIRPELPASADTGNHLDSTSVHRNGSSANKT